MNSPDATPNIIGGTEARAILGGIDASTLSRLVSSGRLPHAGRLNGAWYVFDEAAVRAFAADYLPQLEQRRQARGETPAEAAS